MRRLHCFCLMLSLLTLAPRLFAQPASTDPDLAAGIRSVEEGDFETALTALSNAVRTLSGDPARTRELAQAHLHLGVAYVLLDHEKAGRASFREALKLQKDLRLGADEFPPKVVRAFDAVRQDTVAEADERRSDAPASQPSQLATLVVSSTPAAAVTVDGQPQGRTPLKLSGLAPGRHTLTLTADDGRKLEEEVSLLPGTTVERDLRLPAGGTLAITSATWCEVSVDGGPPQQTPIRIEKLAAGRHVVRATRSGHKDKTMDVEIREGQVSHLEVTLERFQSR
jgi:hypothetical protein